MTSNSAKPSMDAGEDEHCLCDDWFDPLETGVRARIRGFIEELLEAELDGALGSVRYERSGKAGWPAPSGAAGTRHGHREHGLLGIFGSLTIRVPRARLATPEGKIAERDRRTEFPVRRRWKWPRLHVDARGVVCDRECTVGHSHKSGRNARDHTGPKVRARLSGTAQSRYSEVEVRYFHRHCDPSKRLHDILHGGPWDGASTGRRQYSFRCYKSRAQSVPLNRL